MPDKDLVEIENKSGNTVKETSRQLEQNKKSKLKTYAERYECAALYYIIIKWRDYRESCKLSIT